MVAAGNSRKELDIMKSRIILNRERTAKAQEISIPIHGKGGELGIKAVTGLVGLIETLKDCGTCQEVQSVFDAICGYNACCIRCEFIDEKGADELMELVSMLAGQEMARYRPFQERREQTNIYALTPYLHLIQRGKETMKRESPYGTGIP